MEPFSYRLAAAHDCPLLARFNQQLIAEHGDTGSTDFAELLQRMQTWISTRRYSAVLFDDARRQTVAYALYREHRKEIYLRQFLVTRSARRHGYGRRAIELLQSKIWTPGKRLTVEVLLENRAAYRFWHAMGYRNYAVTLEIPPLSTADAVDLSAHADAAAIAPAAPAVNAKAQRHSSLLASGAQGSTLLSVSDLAPMTGGHTEASASTAAVANPARAGKPPSRSTRMSARG